MNGGRVDVYNRRTVCSSLMELLSVFPVDASRSRVTNSHKNCQKYARARKEKTRRYGVQVLSSSLRKRRRRPLFRPEAEIPVLVLTLETRL